MNLRTILPHQLDILLAPAMRACAKDALYMKTCATSDVRCVGYTSDKDHEARATAQRTHYAHRLARPLDGTVVRFDGKLLTFRVTKYQKDGSLAVVLEHGHRLFAVLSVNLPAAPKLGPGEFYAKTWSENSALASFCLGTGLFVNTYRSAESGFVQVPIWRIKDA